MIREANKNELNKLLELYLHLHENDIPRIDMRLKDTWDIIMNDPNHHVIVAEMDNKIVSSCICVVIPNLTMNCRPYAIIENVVTNSRYRRRGLAAACLEMANEIAESEGCYKIMLMSGQKDRGTQDFYRKAGFNGRDKTAFIKWL